MEYIVKPYNDATARRITDGTIKGFIRTREGRNVRILCNDTKGDYQLTGLVDNETDESPMQWTINGKFIKPGVGKVKKHRYDLVLFVPEEEEGGAAV